MTSCLHRGSPVGFAPAAKARKRREQNCGCRDRLAVSLEYLACVTNRPSDENGDVMAGKHRVKKVSRRQTEAYALLGAGVVTLGLGVALTAGSGVAAADSTNASVNGSRGPSSPGHSAATKAIRTTVSAHSVNTSTSSSGPKAGIAGDKQPTKIVTTRDSLVRQQDPAATGDNNPGPAPTITEQLLGQNGSGPTSGIPGLGVAPNIPFIQLGGGGGGLLSRVAGALSGGLF